MGKNQIAAPCLVENLERSVRMHKPELYQVGRPVDYILHTWVKRRAGKAVN